MCVSMAVSHLKSFYFFFHPNSPRSRRQIYFSVSKSPPPPSLLNTPHSNSLTNFSRISSRAFTSPRQFLTAEEGGGGGETAASISDHLRNLSDFVRSISPGGTWWNLRHAGAEISNEEVKSIVTLRDFLRQMWELLESYRWLVFIAFASLIIAAVADINMPRLLAASVFLAQRGETAAFSRNIHLLVVLCVASGVGSGLRSGCFALANVVLVKRLRERLYSAIIFQDITFFDTEEVGGLTSRLGADCQRLSNVIGNYVNLIVRNVIQGTGALINLLSLSWPLALSSLFICCGLATIFSVYGQYQKRAAKLTQDFTACANEVAEETLSLIKNVRVYGTENLEVGRYKFWMGRLAFVGVRESVAYGFWNMSFNTLYRSMQILAVLLGGMSIRTGHVSTEQLTKYILYCEWLIYATWRVVDNLSSLLQAIGASETVFQLMQLSPSDQFLSKGVKFERLKGELQFVGLSFHYPSRPTVPIFEHLDLSIHANEVVGVVGLSGSGKTTLVNLLLRLYEPVEGQIYIDGLPLKELDIRWLRENIGYVEQEPRLFHMDIKSNISYGFHQEIKQDDIEWAAKLAYAHEFISCLPNGYETLIDDNLLSGGQKQRIAIARAILRNPAILIFDEATSALDPESEHLVKDVLHMFKNEEKSKRTIIIIAHRLSTIKAVDRIIVMDAGRVAEMGKHKELLLKDGLYSRLIKMQEEILG